MFGSLRFLLAYLVILSHLVGTEYVAHFGFYAVRGFFVISGLMMTAALNEVYNFDGARFWTNRALRLLPPYYLICALTLIAIALAPEQAAQLSEILARYARCGDLLINLAVLPLQFPYGSFRFIPPFWSVAIEIDMYLLLFLIVSRRIAWALIAMAVGLSFQLACIFDAINWGFTISRRHRPSFPSPSARCCIFCGRAGDGWRHRSPRDVPSPHGSPIWSQAARCCPRRMIFGPGYLIDTLCFAVVVSGLSGLSGDRFGPLVERIDRTLGEWSYFTFLGHWLAGFLVAGIFFDGDWRGWTLLVAVTPVVLVASAALAWLNRILWNRCGAGCAVLTDKTRRRRLSRS